MYKEITKMDNYDELNNARFISRDEIPLDEEVDTNACIMASDVSTIASDVSDEESFVVYTEEDIIEAQQFGVSVEELFKIYEEINNYDDECDPCNCQEWPNWTDGGYEDEGQLESMY